MTARLQRRVAPRVPQVGLGARRRDRARARDGARPGVSDAPRAAGSLNNNRMLVAWLRINPNGTVTVFTGKIELGQGIATALAQVAADELDVDYAADRDGDGRHLADARRRRDRGESLDGAERHRRPLRVRRGARAAARRGRGRARRAPADLKVADGTMAAPGGKQATYWEVTSDAMLRREATAKAKPKGPASTSTSARASPAATSRRSSPAAPRTSRTCACPGMLHRARRAAAGAAAPSW